MGRYVGQDARFIAEVSEFEQRQREVLFLERPLTTEDLVPVGLTQR